MLLVLILAASFLPLAEAQSHYIFFNRDREKIATAPFLSAKAVTGAQLKYVWRELEPQKDRYDFTSIRKDLAFLTPKGKRLFIQLQDASFDESIVNVPAYLRTDPAYHGGVARQYIEEQGKRVPNGWVARRWDAAVRARFHKLLAALGQEFDGRIAGINLAETSIGVETAHTPDFHPAAYRDAVVDNMRALKRAFPKSIALQYANFMPGEWLPGEDKGYLRSVYAAAREIGVAVGGPDLLPYRKGQLAHAYPLILAAHGAVPTAIAVQDGNYEHRNPQSGAALSVADLFRFAQSKLQVDLIFWGAQEPYYSRDLLPFLTQLKP